jgi:hypothetical protein
MGSERRENEMPKAESLAELRDSLNPRGGESQCGEDDSEGKTTSNFSTFAPDV